MDFRIHSTTIASHFLRAVAEGRADPCAQTDTAIALARRVQAADAMLGPVCCADLHDRTVEDMAGCAYVIGTVVDTLTEQGRYRMDHDEAILWSAPAREISIAGFGLLCR